MNRYVFVVKQEFEFNININANSLDEAERIYQTSKQIQDEWMDNIVNDEQPELVEINEWGNVEDLPKTPWVKIYKK